MVPEKTDEIFDYFLLLKYDISFRQKNPAIQLQTISVLVSSNLILDGKRKERIWCLTLLVLCVVVLYINA